MKLGHCMTALITPMTDTGELDLTALSNLVEKLIAEGCDGFVVCGTTAEASALSREEKQQVLRCVLRHQQHRRDAGPHPLGQCGTGRRNHACVSVLCPAVPTRTVCPFRGVRPRQ